MWGEFKWHRNSCLKFCAEKKTSRQQVVKGVEYDFEIEFNKGGDSLNILWDCNLVLTTSNGVAKEFNN